MSLSPCILHRSHASIKFDQSLKHKLSKKSDLNRVMYQSYFISCNNISFDTNQLDNQNIHSLSGRSWVNSCYNKVCYPAFIARHDINECSMQKEDMVDPYPLEWPGWISYQCAFCVKSQWSVILRSCVHIIYFCYKQVLTSDCPIITTNMLKKILKCP